MGANGSTPAGDGPDAAGVKERSEKEEEEAPTESVARPMNKEEALRHCQDLHKALLECQLDKPVFSFKSCLKESQGFWDCLEQAKTGRPAGQSRAVNTMGLPKNVVDVSENMRSAVDSVFEVSYAPESFRKRREEVLRQKAGKNQGDQENK